MSKKRKSQNQAIILKGLSFVKAPLVSSQNTNLSSGTITSDMETNITRDEFYEILEKASRPIKTPSHRNPD